MYKFYQLKNGRHSGLFAVFTTVLYCLSMMCQSRLRRPLSSHSTRGAQRPKRLLTPLNE